MGRTNTSQGAFRFFQIIQDTALTDEDPYGPSPSFGAR